MKRISSIAFAGILLTNASPLAQASLVINGDFNVGNLSGWWSYAADPANQSAALDNSYTLDLTHNLSLTSASSTYAVAAGQLQNPVIGAEMEYNLSFDFSATNTPSWGSAAASIKYYDASSTYLGFVWIPLYHETAAPNTDGQWLTYDTDFTTPANTASMSLEFVAWNWTTLHLDNVSITSVPEPTSMMLVSLGCLMLCVRSRTGCRSSVISSIPQA